MTRDARDSLKIDRRNRWSREPHICVGDPCYHCGTPMVPASRTWPAAMVPAGHRRHGSHGLCDLCYSRRDRDPAVAALIDQANTIHEQENQ